MTGPGQASRKLVVVPEFLPEPHLEMLRRSVDVVYDPDLYADRAGLLDLLSGAAAILIRNRTIVDDELLTAARELTVIGRLGVGLDNIDLDALERAGVDLFPAHGGNAVSVAEYVMGAILVLTRGVYGMTASMKAGEWPRQGHAFGREVFGKTLGLIGLGAIAREVATRCAAFGMRVVAHDPFLPGDDGAWLAAESVTLDDLLADSDVVSVHVPLSEHTRCLVDADALRRMKPTAILINTARGGIVDDEALATALRQGVIAGAALDVFDVEPLAPEAAARFAGLDNVVLTPHLAGNTVESVDRVATMTVETVLRELGFDRSS